MTSINLTDLVTNYTPSEDAKAVVRTAKIVLLVGVTGAGKNTLKQELLKDSSFYDYISHTTRQPRSNSGVMEEDGKDYFFIDMDEAARMLESGAFIEAKKVHTNIYGTAIEGLMPSIDDGLIAVNDVDVQGVEEYKSISPNVHAIFLLPPSFEEWNRRRSERYNGDMTSDDNDVRNLSAKKELEVALRAGHFDFVINDTLSHAVVKVRAIVDGTYDSKDDSTAKTLAQSLYEAL